MRKLTAAAIAVTAAIGAGAGAAGASAAGHATPARPAVERVSVDRHASRAERERSAVRAAVRHDRAGERARDR